MESDDEVEKYLNNRSGGDSMENELATGHQKQCNVEALASQIGPCDIPPNHPQTSASRTLDRELSKCTTLHEDARTFALALQFATDQSTQPRGILTSIV